MSEKLLNAKLPEMRKTKIAVPQMAVDGGGVVLVGTYKERQLAWIVHHGVCNYPVKDGDVLPDGVCRRIRELWLYADAKGTRHVFAATFVGKMTRDEFLSAHPTYAKLGKPKSKGYYIFKVTRRDDDPAEDGMSVVIRAADFGGRSAKVKKSVERFRADGAFAPLAHDLPGDLARLPHRQLRVCEPGAQMEFLQALEHPVQASPSKDELFSRERAETVARYLDFLRPQRANGFTHVDCFSGVGGFCTGLHAAGFTTKVAIEKIRSCVETYKVNHPGVHVINNDICKVSSEEILPYCPADGVDLVTSGMPCETFSTAGNTSRSFYDERQFLFRQGIRVAQITNAKFLLFENVPAITTKTTEKGNRELIVDVLKAEMAKAGYGNFLEVVLDATRFGVPQKRKRYFVLGTRFPECRLYKPVPVLARPFTVGDAFVDLPPVVPNSWAEASHYLPSSNAFTELMRNDVFWRRGKRVNERVSYQMPMRHRPATLERFGLLRPGEGLRDLFERYTGSARAELQKRRVLPKKVFIKRNYRLPVSMPSPCVTSHCLDEFVHPREDRALTVRECARLQSFPDSYDFAGGPYIVPHIDREVQDKYEQIGDAVPPLLAYAWGRVIARMLQERAR